MGTKKIAIVTMTGGANYGNALQNYAVLKLIELCGYEAETLNITTKRGYPDRISDTSSLLRKLRPGYAAKWVRNRIGNSCGAKNDADFKLSALRKVRKNAPLWRKASEDKNSVFAEFQQNDLKYTDFAVSNLFFDRKALLKYDAFVCGSDQVWNPNYPTNSMVEFLQMAPKEKRVAFVPSFGVSEIPECRKVEYAEWIREIPYLSVRETAGAKIIQELTGRDATVLLDPTFGLTKDDWLRFAQKPAGFHDEKSFVFCYFLGNRTDRYTKLIESYAAQNNCGIIDVCDAAQPENYSHSPREFVWLLANAKAVFTDSFHGCAFSINLEKPFVVFDRAGDGCISQSSRITTVLRKTGLESRAFDRIGRNEIDGIRFEEPRKAIEGERAALREYLKTSLDSAVSAEPSAHLTTKRHCTGCGACANVCPQNAITMAADREGFLYPRIDLSKCICCHLCEKACPADMKQEKGTETKAYYAFSNDETICRSSSSGGVFSELAHKILAEGGIVFGAGFDKTFSVCHLSAENEEELQNLRGSKYVQSDLGHTFRQVSEQIKTGRKVLFTGTPCQIAALRSYLGKDHENLLLVDIICHGVPSPELWKKYLQQEHGEKAIWAISFRNKDLGWNDFSMKVEYADGSCYRELAAKDPFERAFLANLTLRPSCYQCQYKTVERSSDLTIADYWGVELVHPELKDQQGVSLVLTHSIKGEALLHGLNNVTLGETDGKRAITMNSACTKSVPWPTKRNEFFALQESVGIRKAVEECLRPTKTDKLKRFIIVNGSRIKKLLRRIKVIK